MRYTYRAFTRSGLGTLAGWSVLGHGSSIFSRGANDSGSTLREIAAEKGLAFGAVSAWFPEIVRRGNAERFVTEHIRAVVGRYAGKIETWDVVNEAIAFNDGRPDNLRKTVWLDLLGPKISF